ncbi:hypothetical protein [Psychrobacillus lasiicapitis]|uniref:Phage tail protein n=1 Tax=Psychrobacillus lasiicapitis TaxID=1636719 RepID=A0A544TAL9_9BACI|nr:hypothetical protein [Psychrobacillus lasiicapitis]TQR14398.1 hypothetical protein FG382_08040 [Psychrobacillus lasiicapitis]GGA31691.1 hypothetical protein GCM10011384_21530 [Psychrobacillus lasiicapitis]
MAMTLEELQILITTETSGLRRELNNVKNEMSGLDKAVKGSTDVMKKAFAGVAAALATLGIGKYVKDAIMASSQLESAFLGLQSIVEGQGRSFAKAKGFINDYIADGLVPVTNAVTAYKNLAARGYNDEQIVQTMERLKDAAAFGRQASYSLGDAVTSATEGLKNENSILVDNAGVTKNVAKMWDDYAASIGTTANNLTQQQKIQAEVNGIMEETKFQVGDAARYADTFAGRMSLLSKTMGDVQTNIGDAFMPIANIVIPILQRLANWLVRVTAYFRYFMQAFFGVSKSSKQSNAVIGGGGVAAQDSFGTAAENAGKKAEKSGKRVKKAAEEAKRSVAGFDEINSLTEPSKSSSGDSGSGGGSGGSGGSGGIGLGDMGIDDFAMPEIDTETIPAHIQEMVDKIKKSFKDLREGAKSVGTMFAEAFSGLGPALQPFRDAVEPIMLSLLKLGGTIFQLVDEFIKPAATYILLDFIPSLVVGFVKDFAPVIADALVWGFDLMSRHAQLATDLIIGLWNDIWLPSLEKVKNAWLDASSSIANSLQSLLDGTIKPLTEYILNSFLLPIANQLNRVFVPILTDVVVFALQLVSKTFKNVADTLNNLTTAVLLPALEKIKNAFMDMVPRIGGALQSLLNGTIKPFIDYILNDFVIPIAKSIIETLVPIFTDVLVFAFKETASAFEWLAKLMNDIYSTLIKPLFDLIKKIVTDTLKIVMDLWDKHGKDLLKNLSDLLKNIKDLFQQLWDKVLKPIIQPFLEMLTSLWDKHLKGLIKEIGDFVMKLVNAALEILNKFILPLVNYLVEKLGPSFSRTFTFIADIAGTAIGAIADLIKGLLKILGGLIDFIAGVFTGDWKRAWSGIKDVFKGIVDMLSGIFKGALNITIDIINSAVRTIIDTLNNLINGAVKLANKIPGINIGFSSISVPRIPKLARGGIVDGATNFGNYIAGEAGAEMIVPLENTPFVDKLASALGTAVMAAMQMTSPQSSGNDGRDLVIQIDGTTFARLIKPFTDRENNRLGSAIIQTL